jgi:hypothetical protein
LAKRSGVSLGSLKRFETTGQIISAIVPDSIEDKVKNEAMRQFEEVTQSAV